MASKKYKVELLSNKNWVIVMASSPENALAKARRQMDIPHFAAVAISKA